MRLESANNYTHNIVDIAGKHHSLDPQTSRRQLSHQRVADRANGEIVEEGEDEEQRTSRPANAGTEFRDTETSDDHEDDEHAGLAPEV